MQFQKRSRSTVKKWDRISVSEMQSESSDQRGMQLVLPEGRYDCLIGRESVTEAQASIFYTCPRDGYAASCGRSILARCGRGGKRVFAVLSYFPFRLVSFYFSIFFFLSVSPSRSCPCSWIPCQDYHTRVFLSGVVIHSDT